MNQTDSLGQLGLKFNPFPPASTGAPSVGKLWIPDSWRQDLQQRYQHLASGMGDKALAIIGEYGSGKTYVLQWVGEDIFRPDNVLTFTFDNPGIAFYDLANRLLRQVGRYELAKGLWEALSPKFETEALRRLIPLSFPEWLASVKAKTAREQILPVLAGIIRAENLTGDEEIAFRVARIMVETGDRPYFEYRDFVAGRVGSLVAEREEASYFTTLIRILHKVYGASAVAFLIDEFEDVALQRRLNRKQSFEYLATLRRLLDTARDEAFWLVVSMTPEALERTRALDASLVQRFAQPYTIPPLTKAQATELVAHRLKDARLEERDDLWPFKTDALAVLRPTTVSRPRPLIKVLWQAIAKAIQDGLVPPISGDVLREAEAMVFPVEATEEK